LGGALVSGVKLWGCPDGVKIHGDHNSVLKQTELQQCNGSVAYQTSIELSSDVKDKDAIFGLV